MATSVSSSSSSAPPPDRGGVTPSNDLLVRVMSEFDEMPTLRLTRRQAMRLWGLDSTTCDAVLRALVDAHFLERDAAGQFSKVRGGY